MSAREADEYYRERYMRDHQGAWQVSDKEKLVQGARARHFISLLQDKANGVSRHLDVGCSTGILLRAVSSAFGSEPVGVEPGEAYREYCRQMGLRVYAGLEELPEEEHSFDLITLSHVLEHLPDPVGFLQRLRRRWISDPGLLLVEVPNLHGHPSLEFPHLYAFEAATLRTTLQAGGFEVIKVVAHGLPRTRLLPLYLDAWARPASYLEAKELRYRRPPAVRLRRTLAKAKLKLLERLVPHKVWQPLPELLEGYESDGT